jgi:hypothetical protein
MKALAGLALAALLIPAAMGQCVSNVPAYLSLGSSACIRVCSDDFAYSAIQLEGTVSGPHGVPVLLMQAGCQAGPTGCNQTCTALPPPPLVLGGDPYYPDNYYGENDCLIMYLFYMHDAVWGLEIYAFCDGCFCLTYDDQLPVELRLPLSAVAGSAEVTLQWTTASESNNARFELSRAGELKAMLPGLGSSAVGRSYTWTDTDVTPGVRYTYALTAVDGNGMRRSLGTVDAAPHGSSGGPVTEYALYQNFPNPFNPTTQIAFDVKETGFVKLRVFNPLGADVATLVAGEMGTGHYAVPFDASRLTSGLYFYTLTVGDRYTATRKMLLVK